MEWDDIPPELVDIALEIARGVAYEAANRAVDEVAELDGDDDVFVTRRFGAMLQTDDPRMQAADEAAFVAVRSEAEEYAYQASLEAEEKTRNRVYIRVRPHLNEQRALEVADLAAEGAHDDAWNQTYERAYPILHDKFYGREFRTAYVALEAG
jgi:hypothetical protein